MPEPRAFGVEDRPPCPSCGAEMHLFRRSPEPGHHAYEVQIFSCMKCDAEMTRSADRKGKPHPSAVSIELETLLEPLRAAKDLFVKKSKKAAFDPKLFLAKVGDGKAVSNYQKDQIVFRQGDVADAIFYIQSGKIKITVVSERGKEAVVGVLEPTTFLAKHVSMAIRCGSLQLRRSTNR